MAGLAARSRRPPRRGRNRADALASRDGMLPLSFAQQRLWFLDQLGPAAFYNIPAALRCDGPLDSARWSARSTEIVRRHEALRTTFAGVAGAAAGHRRAVAVPCRWSTWGLAAGEQARRGRTG